MDHTTDKIHVMPGDGRWDVEDQDGALLTQDPDRDAAVARAKDLARERGLPAVVLHDGDGVTEEIAVKIEAPSGAEDRAETPAFIAQRRARE
jgi:hypothetical protein